MKKILVLITAALLITTTGCVSITGMKSMKEAKNAVINGDYSAALNYADLAIKEGCKDKEFLELVENLKKYQEAEAVLKDRDVDAAEELLNKINDFEGSGMATAIKSLKDDIEDIKEEAEEFEDDIAEIEDTLKRELYYLSSDDAKELLEEKGLTLKQRQKVKELFDAAEAGKANKKKVTSKPTPTPMPRAGAAILTEQEAVDIARKAMSQSAADATVQLIEDYYLINFTNKIDTGSEIITDESCCKVDCKTGEVYDQAG